MDSGFHNTTPWHWIPATWILDYNYSWIPDPISWIPDSKAVDSGFHRLKLPGFRIPDYLTWGDWLVDGPYQFTVLKMDA